MKKILLAAVAVAAVLAASCKCNQEGETLDFLPETFSVEEAKRVRQKQGMDTEKTVKMISTWKSRGYVIQISDFSFKKAYKDVTKRNKKQ